MEIYKNGVFQQFGIFAQAVGVPVGFIYQYLATELDPTQLRLNGAILNRNRYSALWSYVEKHPSLLKTETEWQEIASQDNGVCRFFSSGDGSTTFRLPKYPDSEILGENTPDFVVQAFGYVSKDGALDLSNVETIVEEAINENNLIVNTTIDNKINESEEELRNDVAAKYLSLSGGTLTGNLTVPKIVTTTGIEIY